MPVDPNDMVDSGEVGDSDENENQFCKGHEKKHNDQPAPKTRVQKNKVSIEESRSTPLASAVLRSRLHRVELLLGVFDISLPT